MAAKNKPWGDAEKSHWLSKQIGQRSYYDDVLMKLPSCVKDGFKQVLYGSLSYDSKKYPLYAVVPENWDSVKKTVLVTGGVHGYETSGVLGALRFLEEEAVLYSTAFNVVVAPCVSPWAYETINRWNNKAVDPNRSFKVDGAAEEATNLMKFVSNLKADVIAHIDLHETTDTDQTIFCPALAARDALGDDYDFGTIPDGFYLCGDTEKPELEFQKAVLDAVSKVTHIAEEDKDGMIIGTKISYAGLILYPSKMLGLCSGMTDTSYKTTTEVYPDSPRKVTGEECIKAQVAAVKGGLDYIIRKGLA